MLKNRVKTRVLTHAKIRGGLGEIIAVRYRVRSRLNMWYNFYDTLLGSLGD